MNRQNAEDLFDTHQRWANRLVKVFIRRSHIPKDRLLPGQLSQAALIGLWRAAQLFDPAKGNFKTYARRWVLGSMADEIRGIMRQRAGEVELLETSSETNAHAAIDVHDFIETHIPKKKLREIVQMFVLDGYSQTDIAKRIGLSRIRVQRLYYEALEQARVKV